MKKSNTMLLPGVGRLPRVRLAKVGRMVPHPPRAKVGRMVPHPPRTGVGRMVPHPPRTMRSIVPTTLQAMGGYLS